jgi:galactonate dehydratase
MRIVRVDVIPVDAAWRVWVFLRIVTDEGLTGLGEATVEGQDAGVVATARALTERLINREVPKSVSLLRAELLEDSFWEGIVYRSVVGGLEMALLDLIGKSLGVPVHVLLGGALRSQVACYTHVSEASSGHSDEQRAEEARAAIDAGWKGVKWDPLPVSIAGHLDPVATRAVVAQVETVRRELGPDPLLMLDLHGRLDPPSAIRLVRYLAPYDPYFVEEPVPPQNIAGLVEVARHSPVPLATGERILTRPVWWDVLSTGAIEHAQPDIIHVGGPFEARYISALCETRGVRVAPHNPNGPVATVAAIHLAACLPNLSILEMPGDDYLWFARWRDELLVDPSVVRVADGFLSVPQHPGLGIELDEAAVEHYRVSL